jgi:hypothetical protein
LGVYLDSSISTEQFLFHDQKSGEIIWFTFPWKVRPEHSSKKVMTPFFLNFLSIQGRTGRVPVIIQPAKEDGRGVQSRNQTKATRIPWLSINPCLLGTDRECQTGASVHSIRHS